jgi:hypothetical protein
VRTSVGGVVGVGIERHCDLLLCCLFE